MNKLVFFITLIPVLGFSQSGQWWEDSVSVPQKGEVKIVKDKRIEQLIEFKTSVRPPNTEPTMEGFRIQVFFDQERTAIDEARKKLLTLRPDLATYIEYQAPNYILLVGNFRSKIDAEKLLSELLSEFPEGIVIKTEVFLPKIEKE